MSMDLDDLRSSLRHRIGNPPSAGEGSVNNRTLDEFLYRGLEFMAGELDMFVTTATSGITLVADQQEYDLPAGLIEMLWVEHNSVRLTPGSTFAWDRDGTDWRGAESGTPREFALQGRKIIFYPPPDSTAVSDDSTPTFRYLGTAAALTSSGTTGLGDQDQILAVYWAAWQYCLLRANDPAFAAMAKANEAALQGALATAKRRYHQMIADYQPEFAVRTRREGAAR